MERSWGQEKWLGEFVESTQKVVEDSAAPALLGVGLLSLDWGPSALVLADARVLKINPEELFHPRGDGLPPFVLPLEMVDDHQRELLGIWKAPPQTQIMAVERPEPLGAFSTSRPVWTQAIPITSPVSRVRGTLGPKVATPGVGSTFLTAGHVAGPPGTAIERVHLRRFRSTKRQPFGSVLAQWDPVGYSGYDVAVVVKDHKGIGPVPTLPIARVDQYRAEAFPATLLGGISGRGDGLIEGSLAVHTDGTRRWKNSWIFVPGHLGMEGDSGSAVITPRGEVVGILVGGSRVAGNRQFAALYVQDLESIERDVLGRIEPNVTLEGRE